MFGRGVTRRGRCGRGSGRRPSGARRRIGGRAWAGRSARAGRVSRRIMSSKTLAASRHRDAHGSSRTGRPAGRRGTSGRSTRRAGGEVRRPRDVARTRRRCPSRCCPSRARRRPCRRGSRCRGSRARAAGRPSNASLPGNARLGPARVPVVAVGDEQHVVARACTPASSVSSQPPSARSSARAIGVSKRILSRKPKRVDVGVEVRRDLRVVREVRVRPRHREVRELHAVARRVDVQVAVGGRHPVAVAEDPVAADAVGRLEAVERDPALVQRLGGRDPGRAGADDRGGRQLGHEGGGPPGAINVTDASPYRARAPLSRARCRRRAPRTRCCRRAACDRRCP